MLKDREEPENEMIEVNSSEEIKRCNAYRIDVGIEDECVIMNFGQARQLEDGNSEVTVLAKIALPFNEMFLFYLVDLYNAGKMFEEKAGIALFPDDEESTED